MPADPESSAPPPEASEPLDRVSIGLLAAAGLLFLCKAFLALNGVFEVDEFNEFNQGQAFLADPAGALASPHRLLAAVTFSLGVVLGQEDPVVGLMVNRTLVIVANVAIYLAVLRLAERAFRRLAAFHALIGLGMVLVFIDHSFTARVDILNTALYMVSLALLLERRAWSFVCAGLAMGLAFYFSLKSTLMLASVVAALGVLLWTTRPRLHALRDGLLFGAGLALPHLLYLVLRATVVDTGPSPVEDAVGRAATVATVETGTMFGRFYLSALRQNPVFFGIALLGLVLGLMRWFRGGERRIDAMVVLVAVAVYTGLALVYSQPWPYFLATTVPGLAILWGSVCGGIHRKLTLGPISIVHLGLLTVLVVLGLLRPADRVRHDLQMDNSYQVAVIDRLTEVVGPDELYFDGLGMVPTRAHTGDWLDVVEIQHHLQDPARTEVLVRTLAGGETAALVANSRTEALPAPYQEFKDRYFVQDWGNIYTPGAAFDTASLQLRPGVLPVITAGTFHVRGDPEAWRHLRLDGQPLAGPTVPLALGEHRVDADRDVGPIRIQRYQDGFVETREPLDGYRSLFPKEQNLLQR